MLLLDLKNWINSLTEDELSSEIAYYDEDSEKSGFCQSIAKISHELFWVEVEDGPGLFSKARLLDIGYEEDEIANFAPALVPGDYLFLG